MFWFFIIDVQGNAIAKSVMKTHYGEVSVNKDNFLFFKGIKTETEGNNSLDLVGVTSEFGT